MLAQSLSTLPLSSDWKDRLDLANRSVPELYEDPETVRGSSHANAVRTILQGLNASAVLCVQGAPTIVIVVVENYEHAEMIDLHGALWNQGLASLLLVLTGNTVRAFSLACTPYAYAEREEFENRCQVRALNAITDALAIKDIVYGAESGRLWKHHSDYFKTGERIDQVLLNNLSVSQHQLCESGLPKEEAQVLLIQTMFVAYLEDRGIIGTEYFNRASNGTSGTLLELLESENTTALDRLFEKLRKDFNGDLFGAPCSFDSQDFTPAIGPSHLRTLARFRDGREIMETNGGQLRFWGYDFRYIPIELMSAVYDRFLGSQEDQQVNGAYYTPMFVADTVISTLWDSMSEKSKSKGRFLDPACGSGMFLVRSFQLLCEHWRETHQCQKIRWNVLLRILSRLTGYDINTGAVRVAVFSLYVALLEEVTPSDLLHLSKEQKPLPRLWGQTLRAQDFFHVDEISLKAEVILGNPPWSSRHGGDSSSMTWCRDQQFPAPSREVAWAFVWKSLQHLKRQGTVGFLLPAMGFLHNHANHAVRARVRLAKQARIVRIVNFSDLRFQLFEKASRAAALIVLRKRETNEPGYRFDYWVPKADLNLKMRRVITVGSLDKTSITSMDVEKNPFVFKQRLWLSNPEAKLFGYLKALPSLGEFVEDYRAANLTKESSANRWIVGNGFQPAVQSRLAEDNYQRHRSDVISTIPYLPVGAFQILAQATEHLSKFDDRTDGLVYRKGFERGFTGVRVLIPKGIRTVIGRLRACYTADPLTFQDAIVAISVPEKQARKAKLLTALLNSKLLYWFTFHGTASFGAERPIIRQADLLRLPFPAPGDFLDKEQSIAAESALVSIVDRALANLHKGFTLLSNEAELLNQLDSLSYSYFGLGDEEIALVEDAVINLIPNVQPHTANSIIDLAQPPRHEERAAYAYTLASCMAQWLSDNTVAHIKLEAKNRDLALLHIQLRKKKHRNVYNERNDQSVGAVFDRLRAQLDRPLPGNFQLVPDFRMFLGESLYLVKPLQRRFWLKSSAISDADAIALDLQDALQIGKFAVPDPC